MRVFRAALLRGQGRPAGAVLTALLVGLLLFADYAPEHSMRLGLFDRYQQWQPRERVGDGVVVVEIDERSLKELGQWPWPRQVVAQLVRQIAAQRPAALGIDVLFAEADRLSPEKLAQTLAAAQLDATQLARLPQPDQELADALRSLPSVLGVGALSDESVLEPGVPYRPMILQSGGDATDFVPHYAASLRSIDLIDQAAGGHGALNPPPDGGVVRRVPTLICIGGDLVPGLATEILRNAGGDAILRVQLRRGGVAAIEVAGLHIPTDADGGWWLHFSNWLDRPRVSAVDVLRGNVPPELMQGRIALLGYTAL
ncbi:MAG TPA: CHASE2 domain-containing protein, partial [Solimonas sp.]|nr:CHASE2 domain-containing protein [Solimonas sp.]